MGISDLNTDFFATHKAQCEEYATILEKGGQTQAADAMRVSAALCGAAIAKGSKRADMPSVVSGMPDIVSKYEALPDNRKNEFMRGLTDTKSVIGGK